MRNPSLRTRVLALLADERVAKLAARERGLQSNCGLGLPYWQLRERLGVRGPLGRLRLRRLVAEAQASGLVRTFTAYDSAAGVGRVVERTEAPLPTLPARREPLPPGQAGYIPRSGPTGPVVAPPRPSDRPERGR